MSSPVLISTTNTTNVAAGIPGASASITNITQAALAVVTFSGSTNPFSLIISYSGLPNLVTFSNVVGMTQINGLTGTIVATGGTSGAWTITVNINSLAFTAYASAGTVVTIGTTGDTRILGAHILANTGAVTLTLAGFQNDVGSAASIVWTGNTTTDTFIFADVEMVIINNFSPLSYTASVANKVWLYMRHA